MKLIPKHLKGDSVKSEEIKILEDSVKEKKKLIPKKKKSRYLNPEFVNDRPTPMLITNK